MRLWRFILISFHSSFTQLKQSEWNFGKVYWKADEIVEINTSLNASGERKRMSDLLEDGRVDFF